jgi:hypothetical protein
MEAERISRRQVSVPAEEAPVQVRFVDRAPKVCPQAARVLCRIVVKMARSDVAESKESGP